MELEAALFLSRMGQARSPVAGGYLHVIAAINGDHLTAFSQEGRVSFRTFKRLSEHSKEIRAYYEDLDWTPLRPKTPLELIAEQAENETTGSDNAGG